MMLDWNLYAKELISMLGEVARVSPDVLRGYRTLSDAGKKTGRLDAKTRELIALGVAVTRQCDGCITTHTEAAIKAGATREELIEALGVAVAVNAGAALVYSARTLDAFTTHMQAGRPEEERLPSHSGIDATETDSREGFPASDPPSRTATTRTGRPGSSERDPHG